MFVILSPETYAISVLFYECIDEKLQEPQVYVVRTS